MTEIPSSKLENKKPNVIVIGAGMSGIAAASELHTNGFNVLVLEGRDRIGGRIHTDLSFGVPLDLGASWIHGKFGNPIYELATKMKVRTCHSSGHMEFFGPEGQRVSQSDVIVARNAMNRIFSILSFSRDQIDDVSLQEAFDVAFESLPHTVFGDDGMKKKEELRRAGSLSKAVLDFFLSGMEQYYGASFKHLSCKYYDLEDECPGGDAFVQDGYVSLLQKIVNGFELKLQHTVTEIQYHTENDNTKKVRVITNKGTFEGDYCIVTLPLGVLKQGTVTFTPPLPPEKQNAINRLGFGLMNKIVLQFKKSFWSDGIGSIGYASTTRGEFRWHYSLENATGQPILVCFTSAQFGEDLEVDDDNLIVQKVLHILRKCYPNVEDPIKWIVTKWKSDPFAYGSYSYYKVGSTPKDYDTLAESVSDILFFAGEATCRQFPGTVHGAYLSGKREADRIIKLWKHQKTNRMSISLQSNNHHEDINVENKDSDNKDQESLNSFLIQ